MSLSPDVKTILNAVSPALFLEKSAADVKKPEKVPDYYERLPRISMANIRTVLAELNMCV